MAVGGSQRLRHCGHTHGIASQSSDGANLRRSLKGRALHEEVNALMHIQAGLFRAFLRNFTQRGRIHIRHIKEARAKLFGIFAAHGIMTAEHNMILDQHHITGAIAFIDAAGSVGQNGQPNPK